MFKTKLLVVLSPLVIGVVVGAAMTGLTPLFWSWNYAGQPANIIMRAWEWKTVDCITLTLGSVLSMVWYNWLCLTNKYQHKTAGNHQSVLGMLIAIFSNIGIGYAAGLDSNPLQLGLFAFYSYEEFFASFAALATTCSMLTLLAYTVLLYFKYRNTAKHEAV